MSAPGTDKTWRIPRAARTWIALQIEFHWSPLFIPTWNRIQLYRLVTSSSPTYLYWFFRPLVTLRDWIVKVLGQLCRQSITLLHTIPLFTTIIFQRWKTENLRSPSLIAEHFNTGPNLNIACCEGRWATVRDLSTRGQPQLPQIGGWQRPEDGSSIDRSKQIIYLFRMSVLASRTEISSSNS